MSEFTVFRPPHGDECPICHTEAWTRRKPILKAPAFWRGFRRGWVIGTVVALPPWLAFAIWWWFS